MPNSPKAKLFFINGLTLTKNQIDITANSQSAANNIKQYLTNAKQYREKYDRAEDVRHTHYFNKVKELPLSYEIEQDHSQIIVTSSSVNDLKEALNVLYRKRYMNKEKLDELHDELDKLFSIEKESSPLSSSSETKLTDSSSADDLPSPRTQ